MTDLPEKKCQDGSTGQYVVTCEYCDKSFLGHERDSTCPMCGSLQKKLCESSPDVLISGGTMGGGMGYSGLGDSLMHTGEEL